jgi:hypothetical protein
MQIPQSKDTLQRRSAISRVAKKANNSGHAIEEATAASPEKTAIIEQLSRELPQNVEQTSR